MTDNAVVRVTLIVSAALVAWFVSIMVVLAYVNPPSTDALAQRIRQCQQSPGSGAGVELDDCYKAVGAR